MLIIREATNDDFENGIWSIFHEIVSEGETYAYPTTTNKEEGRHYWMEYPRKTYVVVEVDADDDDDDGNTNSAGSSDTTNSNCIVGTYYIKTNQIENGAGEHVCNCGYMVSSKSRGKGIATMMCKHSQNEAKEKFGYKAMQYNFVASTNSGAVKLWKKLGFDIVGTLPKAFNSPKHGYVDAYVMYKWLDA